MFNNNSFILVWDGNSKFIMFVFLCPHYLEIVFIVIQKTLIWYIFNSLFIYTLGVKSLKQENNENIFVVPFHSQCYMKKMTASYLELLWHYSEVG